MSNFKKDFWGAIFIGILASIFSLFFIKNLNEIINKKLPWLSQNAFWLIPLFFVLLCALGIILARFFAKRIPVFYQFIKFAEVGGLNFLVDNGTLNLFMWLLNTTSGLSYSIAKSVSVLIAMTNSYLWNKFWVFESQKKDATKEAGQFYIVSFIGYLINVGVASLLVNYLSLPWDIKIIGNMSSIFGSICALFWNFIGYKYWVFKK